MRVYTCVCVYDTHRSLKIYFKNPYSPNSFIHTHTHMVKRERRTKVDDTNSSSSSSVLEKDVAITPSKSRTILLYILTQFFSKWMLWKMTLLTTILVVRRLVWGEWRTLLDTHVLSKQIPIVHLGITLPLLYVFLTCITQLFTGYPLTWFLDQLVLLKTIRLYWQYDWGSAYRLFMETYGFSRTAFGVLFLIIYLYIGRLVGYLNILNNFSLSISIMVAMFVLYLIAHCTLSAREGTRSCCFVWSRIIVELFAILLWLFVWLTCLLVIIYVTLWANGLDNVAKDHINVSFYSKETNQTYGWWDFVSAIKTVVWEGWFAGVPENKRRTPGPDPNERDTFESFRKRAKEKEEVKIKNTWRW